MERHHFLLRRLHSLSGILPVGVFVIAHLFTNAQMIWNDGGKTFQHEVDFIHSIPGLLFIEITLWASIGFHAALGLVYTFGGKANLKQYHGKKFEGNLRYTLQRASGFVALGFIFIHIATLRWRWSFGIIDTPFYAHIDGQPAAMLTTAKALQHGWLIVLIYLVGALAVVYHWSNGLWTAAITWGLTISTKAQKRWGLVCAAMGAALTVFTLLAIVGALKFDVAAAEAAMKAAAEASGGNPPAVAPAHP